jgi:hypothetical protein
MENARLLSELHQRTEEVAELNRGLEARVAEQVEELGRRCVWLVGAPRTATKNETPRVRQSNRFRSGVSRSAIAPSGNRRARARSGLIESRGIPKVRRVRNNLLARSEARRDGASLFFGPAGAGGCGGRGRSVLSFCGQDIDHGRLAIIRRGGPCSWDRALPPARATEEQSGREFASADATARAQDAAVQEPGSAQKFLSTHAAVCNTFNVQRHLSSGQTHRTLRAAAMDTWPTAVAAA